MRWLPLLLALTIHPAIIGSSRPAESLTRARILAQLPPADRQPWLDYLDRSEAQLRRDHEVLAAERAHLAGPIPPLPAESSAARSIPADADPSFFQTPTALRMADTIVSFQTPAGGWSKNLDMASPPRLPGQSFTTDNLSRHLGPDDFDAPRDPAWNYVGTLDNDATTTELRFLARIAAALPGPPGDRFRASFLRGIDYLLAAQFPNGGWPQVWPLEGGYHDAITFNDNAVTAAASLLADVARAALDYAFVPAPTRARARAAAAHAVRCILATQVRVAGALTVWAQQHDALTLAPVAGRNFEPAALSASESADILLFLMQVNQPTPEIEASMAAGITWLRAHSIPAQRWVNGTAATPGRHLEPSPGAPALWPRYTDLRTGQPLFGDRDKSIHSTVAELTLERRNGYAWYSSTPQRALDAYARRTHP